MVIGMTEHDFTTIARLWSNVDIPKHKNFRSMCWNWKASTARGYGQFWLDGTNVRAHRIAYEAVHGRITSDTFVLHKCDNPLCCNPAHLEAGDHAENMRQKSERDRALKGRPRGGRLAAPAGLEPATYRLGGGRSIR